MKKKITLAIALTVAVTANFAIFAGGIENKTNMSTGYLRNPSRNTESERPEAAFYNIAGTGFMNDGLYIEAGNQFIFKEYKHELDSNAVEPYIKDGESYNDETTVFLYPNVDVVYKLKNFAIFANFGVYAGGGKLDYSEGTAVTSLAFLGKANEYKTTALEYQEKATAAQTAALALQTQAESESDATKKATLLAQAQEYATKAQQAGAVAKQAGTAAEALSAAYKDHSLKVTSITYGEQIGLAYNIKDFVSVSAGVRFLEGSQDLELKSSTFNALTKEGNTVSCEATAFGVSPVFGVHVRPLTGLDVAAQFQLATKMEYEVSNVKGKAVAAGIGDGISNDTTFRADLPAALNIGAGYHIIEPLYVSASFNYYFNKFSECNSIIGKNDYDDSFEIAAGADWRFNEKILASLGVAYGNQGNTEDSNNIFNPILDSFQVGFGAEYTPIKQLTVTAGGTYVKYFEDDYKIQGTYNTKLNKNVFMLSLGVTYKPF